VSMVLKPYPQYKDSGLPWLGRIPAHWDEKRAKYAFREVDDRSDSGNEELLSVSHITGVTPRAQKNVTMFMAESYAGHKLCRPGDLVINTMWAWMGALGIARQAGIVSPSYAVYGPIGPDSFVPDFVDRLLRTPAYVAEYRSRSTGIRSSRLRLYPEQFLDIRLAHPSLEEQRQIVGFLSAFERAARRFVSAKRRLIELLNEQKQAIIQGAVTRGLDANVRLKPSGIDWLGDVPHHWRLRRLKHLVININDQADKQREEGKYLALEHVESWTGRIRAPEGMVAFESQVKRFAAGDILFGKLRPYLAKVARPAFPGVCVGEFLVLRPIESEVAPAFIEQKLRSPQVINIVNSSTFGAKMPRADWSFIGGLTISFPPAAGEQNAVLEWVRKETACFDIGIERTAQEIRLIREYRERLFADVVTGRLDVRGVVLPTEDESLEAVLFNEEPAEEAPEDSEEFQARKEVADADE